MKNEQVVSKTYRLVAAGEVVTEEIQREVKEGWVVVEPIIASVCHADLRYYTGSRRPEAMKKKLPMALLHEGIGKVIESRSEKFSVGDRVVIVPNIPGQVLDPKKYPNKEKIPVNYTKGNQFLGSGYDGIAQSKLVHPAECLVKIPDNVPDEIAVLAELCTVSYHGVSHIADRLKNPKTKVALFGDGPVGYLTATMIRYMYGVDETRFTVFGADRDKLSKFTFAHQEMVQEYDFANNENKYDVVLECTGGRFSESALNQAIEIFAPCGDLVIMGVSEERVPINTRDILEKGLRLYGSSRSSTADFEAVIQAFEIPEYRHALQEILPDKWDIVTDEVTFKRAMDKIVANRAWHKTILDFQWDR